MRAGGGFGVVLDAEDRQRVPREAFEGVVVEVDVGDRRRVGSVAGSTAKPWFWVVISTLPVRSLRTGWLAPRWPNLSLKVRAPKAWPRSWWPRQMPKIGSSAPISSRTLSTYGQRLRIAGTVRQEDAVGLQRQHVARRGARRHHGQPRAPFSQGTEDVGLHAEVVDHHVAPLLPHRRDLVGRGAGHLVDQRPPRHGRELRPSAARASTSERSVVSTPRSAPRSRRRRTTARVSSPWSAGIPYRWR